MTRRVGYTTGTFDMVHSGHIGTLKFAKKLLGDDGLLIVGITSDELCKKQKREPFMSFEHRRSVIDNFPFVDIVIEHVGTDKLEMVKRMHITDIFIGDDYVNDDDYNNLENQVSVHYLQNYDSSRSVSTTDLAQKIKLSFLNDMKIIKNGIAGYVYKMSSIKDSLVVKTINVTKREFDSGTSNAYKLPTPPPRNWKHMGIRDKHPNIPGVNIMREIYIQKYIKDYPWSTYISHHVVNEGDGIDTGNIKRDAEYPKRIYFMTLKDAGMNLKIWINSNRQKNDFKKNLGEIIKCVRKFSEDLIKEDVVHGDIHAENICVDSNHNVCLIDFGWCSHPSFQLDKDEREYHEKNIRESFDWNHFVGSLYYEFEDDKSMTEILNVLFHEIKDDS